MSGVVAAVVTSVLNARREERQEQRRRLEALYTSFSGFCTQLVVLWHPYTSVMEGKLTYNQALELQIESGAGPRHFEQVKMLVAIYWPTFEPYLLELDAIREKGNAILDAHKQRYKNGCTEDRKAFKEIGKLAERLDDLEKRFTIAVRDTGRSINGLRGPKWTTGKRRPRVYD